MSEGYVLNLISNFSFKVKFYGQVLKLNLVLMFKINA
jgi:hypothetical protein